MSAAAHALARRRTPAEIEQAAALNAARERMAAAARRRIQAEQKTRMDARLAAQMTAVERAAQAMRAAEEERGRKAAAREAALAALAAEAASAAAKIPSKYDSSRRVEISSRTLTTTADAIAQAYGLDPMAMFGRGQSILYVTARAHLAAALAKLCPMTSLSSIGRAIGRDRTTVMHMLWRWNQATGEHVWGLSPDRGYSAKRELVFRDVPGLMEIAAKGDKA